MVNEVTDSMSSADRALLIRHSPILRFDDREQFFPMSVDSYVATAALVVNESETRLPGEVMPEMLDHDLGSDSYLRFVSDHDRRSLLKEQTTSLLKLLGPRLGRVGFFGRILDALFVLSVQIRPTTPRLTSAAALIKAERHAFHDRPTCYARVVQTRDWKVLHYAYFYAMNDWRSTYRGLNDHEADWEQAWIFCDPEDNQPVWVAASSHDFDGANLRRHWDDKELVRVGSRPVLYPGAGSHALFFRPGDYVSRLDVPALRWLLRIQVWTRLALRIHDERRERGLGPALGVPFVDAAGGDGVEIVRWDLNHLDELRSCFGSFRGLWGLDTGDPLNGERGPSGPKFERNGEIRHSWVDPVGFVGLHGQLPPSQVNPAATLANIEHVLARVHDDIELVSRRIPLVSMGGGEDRPEDSEELTALLRQRTHLEDLRRRLQSTDSLARGHRDHLHDPAIPLAPPKETGWILAIWATISVPLVISAVAVVLLLRNFRVLGLVLLMAPAFTLAEQLVRRRYTVTLRLLGFYAMVALFFGFVSVITVSFYAFGAVLAVAALLLFAWNVGEFRAVSRRKKPISAQVEVASGSDGET